MINTEFFLTSLVVVLVPGTGVIYTVSTGLVHRWRASLAAALGCTAGIIPHLIASILGLSAILHMSARVFEVIKWVGVIYLLYLAWGMWRDKGSLTLDQTATEINGFQIATKGILITAYGQIENYRAAQVLDAYEIVHKPFQMAEIHKLILQAAKRAKKH